MVDARSGSKSWSASTWKTTRVQTHPTDLPGIDGEHGHVAWCSRLTCTAPPPTSASLLPLKPEHPFVQGHLPGAPGHRLEGVRHRSGQLHLFPGKGDRGGAYVGIATHDPYLGWAGMALVDPLGLDPAGYEFQMLLGVDPELRRSSWMGIGYGSSAVRPRLVPLLHESPAGKPDGRTPRDPLHARSRSSLRPGGNGSILLTIRRFGGDMRNPHRHLTRSPGHPRSSRREPSPPDPRPASAVRWSEPTVSPSSERRSRSPRRNCPNTKRS